MTFVSLESKSVLIQQDGAAGTGSLLRRCLKNRRLLGWKSGKQSSWLGAPCGCGSGLSVAAGQSVDILDHIKAHGDWRDDQCPAGPQGAGLQFWESPIVHHH